MKRGRYENRRLQVRRVLQTASGFLLVHALSILLMPLAALCGSRLAERTALRLCGVLFWGALLGGYLLLLFANRGCKVLEKAKPETRPRPGIVTFFSCPAGKRADCVLAASLATVAALYASGHGSSWWMYPALSIVSFSFHMHCLWNGRMYQTAKDSKNRKKRRVDHDV